MAKAKSKTSDITILKAQTIVDGVSIIAGEREQWQQNEYARSNKILYELLGKIQTAYMEASANKTLLAETVQQMKKAVQARKMRVQINTVPLTLFVRYVFNNDRQRAMNYSRTIQAAISAKNPPEKMAAFIEKAGGIEQCKKKVLVKPEAVAKKESIKQAMVQVDQQLSEQVIKPLATFKVSKNLIPAKTDADELTLCLARADASGNVSIICVVPKTSAAVTNWAKSQIARLMVENKDLVSKASIVEAKSEAIEKAKKAASKSKKPTATVGELLAA
jgi:hypothetical protein